MIIRIIILFVLIGINGILSSSEIAFLSLNKYKLNRRKDKKSMKILKILEDESSFLSIIQIGITLSGFLASAFASDSFTEILMNYGVFFVSEQFTENILMILITFYFLLYHLFNLCNHLHVIQFLRFDIGLFAYNQFLQQALCFISIYFNAINFFSCHNQIPPLQVQICYHQLSKLLLFHK